MEAPTYLIPLNATKKKTPKLTGVRFRSGQGVTIWRRLEGTLVLYEIANVSINTEYLKYTIHREK